MKKLYTPHEHTLRLCMIFASDLACRPVLPVLPVLPMFLVFIMYSACVPYARVVPEDTRRFELLHERKLSKFEQRLATERQTGLDDDWTRVGEAWLALSNCTSLADFVDDDVFLAQREAPKHEKDPVARLVHASLLLEEMRRQRLIYHKGTGYRASSISGTMFGPLDDDDFFQRGAGNIPTSFVRWPASTEAWADELPARVQVKSACQNMYESLFAAAAKEREAADSVNDTGTVRDTGQEEQKEERGKGHSLPRLRLHVHPSLILEEGASWSDFLKREAAKLAQGSLAWRELQEFRWGAKILWLIQALPKDTQRMKSIAALRWRVRFHLGFLAGEIAQDLRSPGNMSAQHKGIVDAWNVRLGQWHRALAREEVAGKHGAAPEELRALVLLEEAAFLEAERRHDDALKALRLALELGVSRPNQELAGYQELRLLSKMARWKEVAQLGKNLPDVRSKFFPASVYRMAYAMRKEGDMDRFMSITMKAFRDRPYRADPFMRALYVQMLHVLNDYPFEGRTIELMEDMGERSKLFERVEEYATVALDKGRTENAQAAATWLLAKHLNATYRPRYYALLAMAAFLENSPERFLVELERVVHRPKQVEEAVVGSRRATFFASADAQLARVFRQMLPLMAEWGDGKSAIALRQRWLRLVIERSQEFVRRVPGSMARPELLQLYRLASAMLQEDHPRAYPEKVGNDAPVPLVLGTVRVHDRDLEPYEPMALIQIPQLWSLTLLPRDATLLQSWTPFWDLDVEGRQMQKDEMQKNEKMLKEGGVL